MKKINLTTTLIFLFAALNLNSATHTVTNGNDAGVGSLRQAVFDANSGDTIIFASNVSTVTLKEQITIDKSLTINGGSGDKRVAIGRDTTIYENDDGHGTYIIWTRIFNIPVSNIEVNLNNLIIENGKTDYRSGAIDIFGGNSNKVKITNCIFRNNEGFSGGAILIAASEVVAVDCSFEQNKSYGCGSAIIIMGGGSLISINCSFIQNETDYFTKSTGTVDLYKGSFIAVNNTFSDNNAFGGAAISSDAKIYLYYNTFDKNKADSIGGGVYVYLSPLYSYNSIYTGNTEDGIVSEAGQIRGKISGNGKNLIENGTTVTRDLVFGNNEYENGYIRPLAFAKSAPRLTANDIETPEGIDPEFIISWLYTDQIGKERPDTGFVTFGAIEYDDSGVYYSDDIFNIRVVPNPSDGDFSVVFYNPEEQGVSINLIDLSGGISNLCYGLVPEGEQICRVNKNLASGSYSVLIKINNRSFIKNLIISR